jgi:hypothetical protein
MEKQETHAPHHDEKQKTHAPITMPCAWIRYGDPLLQLPINTGENWRHNRGREILGDECERLKKELFKI